MANVLIWTTYVIAAVVVVVYGLAACFVAFLRHRRVGPDTPEFFLTARNSVGTFRIAWSFYAAAMGSWTLFSPAQYAWTAGWFGLLFYALASGLPILLQGFIGPIVQKRKPNLLSFTDFVQQRYGKAFSVWVGILMVLNMGIAMTAEYTAVEDLFELVIGANRVPIVVIIGVVSMLYTAYGGLYVSIITDQWQAGVSLIMAAILIIWTAVTFRQPLPRPLPPNLSVNYLGLSSIAVMPISLFSSSVFSEAIWQRCWASASDAKLRVGAVWGAGQVSLLVFLFGFGGFLTIWGGLWVPSGPDDPGNTILFGLLNSEGQQVWIMVVIAVLSATMSESAIDSLQNAIVDNISGTFLKFLPLIWTRVLVCVLNIPVMVVSLQGYPILNLFLLANLMTTTSTLPVLLGLLEGPVASRLFTPLSAIFGCWFSFAALVVYGRIMQPIWGGSMADALNNLFFSGNYDWKPFIIALVASVVGMLSMGALEVLVLEPLLGRLCPGYFRRRRRGAAATAPSLQKPQDSGPVVSHVQSMENGSVYSSAYPKE